MTRAHTIRHQDAKFVEGYILRPGAEWLGGTLPGSRPHALRRDLERLAGDDGLLHVTLSLPAGLRADRDTWLRIVLTLLVLMSLPPYGTAWVAARHVDAGCDHIHIAVALRSFTGTPLKPYLSRHRTDQTHKTLARLIGLPEPHYFDPAIPSLQPVTPTRNLSSPVRRQVYQALSSIFLRQQPLTLEMLDACLADTVPAICRETRINRHGANSYRFVAPAGAIYGGDLGLAWEPRHLRARLDFARKLDRLRRELSWHRLAHLLTPHLDTLKKAIHAHRTDPAHPSLRERHLADAAPLDRWQGRPALAPARPSGDPRDRPIGPRPGIDRGIDADRRGDAIEPRIARSPASGPEPLSRGQRRDERTAGAHRGANRHSDAAHLANSEDPVRPDHLTFGAWLGQVLRLLHGQFRNWSWSRAPGVAIEVKFSDGSGAVAAPKEVTLVREGQEAAQFCEGYQRDFLQPAHPKSASDGPYAPEDETDGPGF